MEKSAIKEQIDLLRTRFADNRSRHTDIEWVTVESRLLENPSKVEVLCKMEQTGGEPDVVGVDEKTGAIIFFDCSPESPNGRRSLCFDQAALESRKKNRPEGNVENVAESIGIELLNEEEYRFLQTLGEFDLKTSSWVQTPAAIRNLGGAIFCDRRYNQVFVYHNGAESYYAARGFRGRLWV